MNNRKFKPALRFLGTGGAFSKHPNSAYFMPDEETLVLIDLDTRNFLRAEKLILKKKPKQIWVLVTHMHNDHVSGIPTLAEWLWFKCPYYKGSLYVCAPERLLVKLVRELFEDRNVSDMMITPITAESMYQRDGLKDTWLLRALPTEHVGRRFVNLCYGYLLAIGYVRVLYTGDTRSLEPFLSVSCDEFYCDMSDYGGADRAHPFWGEEKEALIEKAKDCDVYLMHMDKETRERLAGEVFEAGLAFAKSV